MAKGNKQDKLYKLYNFELPVMYDRQVLVEQFRFIGIQEDKDRETRNKIVSSFYEGEFSGGILKITNLDKESGKGIENIAFLSYTGKNSYYVPIYKAI